MGRVLALPISVAVLLTSCSSTPTDVPSPAYERRPPAPAAASSVNPVVQWNRTLLEIVRTPGMQPVTVHPTRSFATSVVFWTKMGLIALLLGNGYIRMRAENALRQGRAAGWGRFRRTSVASLALWLVILLFGTLLHSTT